MPSADSTQRASRPLKVEQAAHGAGYPTAALDRTGGTISIRVTHFGLFGLAENETRSYRRPRCGASHSCASGVFVSWHLPSSFSAPPLRESVWRTRSRAMMEYGAWTDSGRDRRLRGRHVEQWYPAERQEPK